MPGGRSRGSRKAGVRQPQHMYLPLPEHRFQDSGFAEVDKGLGEIQGGLRFSCAASHREANGSHRLAQEHTRSPQLHWA